MSAIAWLSTKLENGKILCEACAQGCTLGEGEYGICGIRKVEGGELQLLTYGIAAAVTIDTADKQPLYHCASHERVLSMGTIGCNFSCQFCQNYDLTQYPKENGYRIDGRRLSPSQAVDLAVRYECQAIAYTYNEPATFFEYCYDTAKLAREAGLKNIYVTSGYETRKAIDLIAPYIDQMIIDLKGFSEPFYHDVCGASLAPVLETIRYVHAKGIPLEMTTPLIPGYNDSEEEIASIALFVSELDPNIPWHILPFKPIYKMVDLTPTPSEKLDRAREIGKEQGLSHVIVRSESENHFKSACHHGCA